MIKIAVLGYGTIGSGVVEVINTNQGKLQIKSGQEIDIKYVLDLRDFPDDPIQEKVVHDFNIILNDPEIEIVVECMGGVEPAYTFVKSALLKRKSVCTSNKELVAKYGSELLDIAKSQNRNFLFEASVGGGIPIIRPLNQCLTADKIYEVTGILNGTTNYILTKMNKEGLDFETVLKEAQNLGYAEKNPSADVDGFDACRKIAILSSLAFGDTVNYEEIYTEGITKITDTDFKYAAVLGMTIKLFGKSVMTDEGTYAYVSPVMINSRHPLYNVEGVLNGILVRGNVIGDVMFFGSGAGKLPTASAVVSDVIDAIKHLNVNIVSLWSSNKLELEDFSKSKKKFFVRAAVNDIKEVKKAFGEVEEVNAGVEGEKGFITEVMSEADFADKAVQLGKVITRIRIEE